MSGKIGGIIVGVLEIVIGAIASAIVPGSGTGLIIAGIATVAGSAISLALQPKATSAEAANASHLKFSNANEGFPVPVVFGEAKVIPNFMNWSPSQFRHSGGGGSGKGGGGSSQSGFQYYLYFEVGLCMGPIDEIGQVICVPGDILMRGNKFKQVNVNIFNNQWYLSQSGTTVTAHSGFNFSSTMVGAQILFQSGATVIIVSVTDLTHAVVDFSQTISGETFQIYSVPDQIVFGSDEFEEFTLAGGSDNSNSNLSSDGGMVRVYRGSATQTRIINNDPYYQTFTNGQVGFNYRNICWALFIDFHIGNNSPVPKTYQFVIRRFPKCVRDDGTTFTGLKTRGSNDSTNANYNQANPAAIIYEMLTNNLWGRGCSSDIIDEDSFSSASEYFAGKNIGMGLTVESPEKLTAFLDGIRSHLKAILSWKNGKWNLRCLLDPQVVAETILTLTSDEVEELQVTRPLWPQTVNDLRCEFNNRRKLYKPDVVHVQDIANIQLTERVNSQNISMVGFSEFNLAAQQAWRVLREASYPLMFGTFYINRFHSQLEVGDCFRLVWNEWGDDVVTAYMDVLKLEPMGKDDDRIRVTFIEDIFFCPVAGTESSISLPTVQSWEKVIAISESDLSYFGEVVNAFPKLYLFPTMAFELPAIFTQGNEATVFVGQSYVSGFIGMKVYYKQGTKRDFAQINPSTGKGTFNLTDGEIIAASAMLVTPPSSMNYFDRSGEFFQFTINNTLEAAHWLAVNSVTQSTDDLEKLESSTDWHFLIGGEIIKIGCIEFISGTTYRARNVIRGVFGTPIEIHFAGDTIFYIGAMASGIDTSKLDQDKTVSFLGYPLSTSGETPIGFEFTTPSGLYYGTGNRPLSPETISIASQDATYWKIFIRPRFFNSGAGTNPALGEFDSGTGLHRGEIKNTKSITGIISYTVFYYDGDGNLLNRGAVSHTFKNETFTDTSGGLVEIDNVLKIINGATVRRVEVFSILNKQTSIQSATFVV